MLGKGTNSIIRQRVGKQEGGAKQVGDSERTNGGTERATFPSMKGAATKGSQGRPQPAYFTAVAKGSRQLQRG